MKKGWKITLIATAFLLFLVLIGPFLVPVTPLKNTQPAQSLADDEGQFIEINGINVHYKLQGELSGGDETVFILLHGFGASSFSWREVMDPLSDYGMVIAYDRPAFGLTERPLDWEGENPYSQGGNINLLLGLMDAFAIEQAVLIGHSAGGTLATDFTLAYPERVEALIEVSAAVYQMMPNSALLNWFLQMPQVDHIGPLIVRRLGGSQGETFLRNAWYDESQLDKNPEITVGYRKPLRVDNWDIALWEHTKALQVADLSNRLEQIDVPTLVISGENDQIVPVENSRRLAWDIPNAELVVIKNCGHIAHEERPNNFMQAVNDFMTKILEEKNE